MKTIDKIFKMNTTDVSTIEPSSLNILTHEQEQCEPKRARLLQDYNVIDRLIRLILTFSVSTATTERTFSAMNIVKTRF